jgi:acid phosphatase
MGKALRRLYVDKLKLLPEAYSPAMVYLRTTDVWRTRQSAMAMMQGLYPPATRYGQTIALHALPWGAETLIPNSAACPRAGQLQALAKTQKEWVSRMAALRPTLDHMVAVTKTKGTSWADTTTTDKFHDTLHARRCHNMPYPCLGKDCITEAEAQKVFEQGEFECRALFEGDESARINGGHWLNYLTGVFAEKIASGNGPRYLHFSAHDSSLAIFLSAMRVVFRFPPYASTLRFELWRLPTGQHALHVIFNNEVLRPFGCNDEMCPFDDFAKMVASIKMADIDKECATKSTFLNLEIPSQLYRA